MSRWTTVGIHHKKIRRQTFEGKIEFDDKLENLHDCIVNTVRDVKEYLQAMETSPPLIAQDLDMPYKKLAEFNSIVLGGDERGNGMGYELTTWEYVNLT